MEKNWLKSYPSDVPEFIPQSTATLNSLFIETCQKFASKSAFTCDNETITFSQTQTLVANFTRSLVQLGVLKGDRVAIMLPNILQYPICLFSVLSIGAIVVNINPLYTTHELNYLLKDSGAKILIILDMMAYKFNDLHKQNSVQHVIVTKLPDLYPWYKRHTINFVIKYLRNTNLDYTYPTHDFRTMVLGKTNNIDFNNFNVTCNDIAFIQYTGGTTHQPKGAVLLHRNIVANILQIHAWLTPQISNLDKQIVMDVLPLYHIFSLTANLFTFFFPGSENILIADPRNLKSLVKVCIKTKFTIFSGLDTLYSHLLNQPKFVAHKFSEYKSGISGGMPANKAVALKWQQVTGQLPTNCYGMTETSPAITMNVLNAHEFDSSVGYPISSTEIEIRDINNGKVLSIDDIGLIWVRGPQLMLEYWNNPVLTAEVMDENGWFNSQDLGYISLEGKLYLTGRQSDMIIVSGFNVYPIEVETVLNAMVGIKESAIIGIPNTSTGEIVIAFVVIEPTSQLNINVIQQYCIKQLAHYKVPHEIHIINELPKTLIGKIDKVKLQQQLINNQKE